MKALHTFATSKKLNVVVSRPEIFSCINVTKLPGYPYRLLSHLLDATHIALFGNEGSKDDITDLIHHDVTLPFSRNI
jgi:hypothetical protein